MWSVKISAFVGAITSFNIEFDCIINNPVHSYNAYWVEVDTMYNQSITELSGMSKIILKQWLTSHGYS